MWMWNRILKILGKILGRPSEEELAGPSEEELAKTLHDIVYPQWLRGDGKWVFLREGEEGFAEAKKLLDSYSGRGFREQKMYLDWYHNHKNRDTHPLGWVSRDWTCISVTVSKTFPEDF